MHQLSPSMNVSRLKFSCQPQLDFSVSYDLTMTKRESNERDNLIEVALMGLQRKLALGKFPGIYSITLAKNP